MWKYKEVGLYYNQVKTFLNEFSNVKIVLFEDLIKDPLKITNEIIFFESRNIKEN